MLRIGFSNKYFTLWEVTTTTEFKNFDGLRLPYQKTYFHYLQNLSMDEKEAKRKAIFKGVENFEIDFDLYGRNASFSKRQELFSKIPSDKSFFFEFGRLKGQKIQDCNDFDYLFWYFQETQNEPSKNRLIENGFEEIDGQVVHAEHAKKIKLRDLVVAEIADKDEIEVIVLSNLNCENELRFEFKNEVFFGCWNENSKGYIYQGIEYFLPIIGGKPKRVKNKPVKVKIGDFKAGVYQIKQMSVL
mgnify:FL=1